MPEAVRLDDVTAGPPIRTSWSAPHGPPPEGGALDQLTDVDGATDADTGTVLVKGSDGIWRPSAPPPSPPLWGDSARWRRGAPQATEAAPVGAVHVDLATGRLWRYTEDQEG